MLDYMPLFPRDSQRDRLYQVDYLLVKTQISLMSKCQMVCEVLLHLRD